MYTRKVSLVRWLILNGVCVVTCYEADDGLMCYPKSSGVGCSQQ
jgi:hypothetical protein